MTQENIRILFNIYTFEYLSKLNKNSRFVIRFNKDNNEKAFLTYLIITYILVTIKVKYHSLLFPNFFI